MRSAGALNATAPANSRPSISGSATFMARSAGVSPRGEAAHEAAFDRLTPTCKTGASQASSTVEPSSSRAEKAVALRITSGGFCCSLSLKAETTAGSLRLVR